MKERKSYKEENQLIPSAEIPVPVHNLDELIRTVSKAIYHAKAHVSTSVNSTMTWLYWGIGRHIVLFERRGKRAVYGQELLNVMGRRLAAKHGRGYSRRSLYLMVEFYESFPDPDILKTVATKLAWTKLIQVLSLKDPDRKLFYLHMAVREGWAVRELGVNSLSGLYERTPASLRQQDSLLQGAGEHQPRHARGDY